MPQTTIVFGGGENLVVTEQLDAVKAEIQAGRQIPAGRQNTFIELNRNTGTKVYVMGIRSPSSRRRPSKRRSC